MSLGSVGSRGVVGYSAVIGPPDPLLENDSAQQLGHAQELDRQVLPVREWVEQFAQPSKEITVPHAEPVVAVTLRPVTAETVRVICNLRTTAAQERFVAPNAVSIAQASFQPRAWFRAIYAGEDPVGFVMLDLEPEKPEYSVWRFMIAEGHQGRGYGAAAIRLVIEHVRPMPGARELLLSYGPGEGSPEGFYRKLGFLPTGEVADGEIVMRLEL